MTDSLIVFVNGTRMTAPKDGVALDAVRLADAAVAQAVERGERAIADSRGLLVAPDTALHGGAIFRVVSARRAAADARDTDR